MKTSILIALIAYVLIMIYAKIEKTSPIKVPQAAAISIFTGIMHFYFTNMEKVIEEPF
jgi:hypothetical protein